MELPAVPDHCKVTPAIAAGCTVVLKPSEVTPLNAYLLAEVLDEVGLPAGVFNLVVGTGPEVGVGLSTHPDVDMVSFTGSGRAGSRGHRDRRPTPSSVSPSSSAASPPTSSSTTPTPPPSPSARSRRFINSGQTCSALTRVLVPAVPRAGVRRRHRRHGRFRLSVAGPLGTRTTADLDFDATAADVQDALEAIVGAGNVLVTKAGGTWVISYRGALAGAAGWARTIGMVTTWTDASPQLVAVAGKTLVTTATAMTDGWIDYTGFENLLLALGGGNDVLSVDSTPGPTTITTGAGNDVVMIETVAAATTVDAGAGDDILVLNPVVVAGEPSGLGGDLNLVGGFGSDYFLVGLWSQLTRKVTITDGFRLPSNPDNDTNILNVSGSLGADTFLFRRNLIALLNTKNSAGAFTAAEMVVYDGAINGGVIVNGLDGDDFFAFDDTSTFMTVNGDSGNDKFYVGQILTNYTTTSIYGIPVGTGFPGDHLFDANFFASTRGWLTNGVSNPVTINGGTGDDLFDIFRNKSSLTLNGEDGDDTFIVRTFVADSELTKVSSGVGRDVIRYVMNAPVAIDGGDGYDTVIFVGTEFADTFVITSNGVYGAGRFISYVNVERLVVDGMEGNDRFYVQSTNPNVETRIVGGLGSDTVEIAGHAPAVQADDLLGHSGHRHRLHRVGHRRLERHPDRRHHRRHRRRAGTHGRDHASGGRRQGHRERREHLRRRTPEQGADRHRRGHRASAGGQPGLDQPRPRRRDQGRHRQLGHDRHADLHRGQLRDRPADRGPRHRRRRLRGHPLRRPPDRDHRRRHHRVGVPHHPGRQHRRHRGRQRLRRRRDRHPQRRRPRPGRRQGRRAVRRQRVRRLQRGLADHLPDLAQPRTADQRLHHRRPRQPAAAWSARRR